ncbi:MAG: DNA-3-methyladenine glycosylase 2 family protein [Elusimicrobia bacterium]|nr:DNA-3-methyladenine glycosylase 2 family protein [Elusimicrobiota bacterium]
MSTFDLAAAAPFRLDFTVWALRRLPTNAIDRWDGRTYRRVLVLDGLPEEAEVSQAGPPERPRLRVGFPGGRLTARRRAAATAALEKLLGLRIDLEPFYRIAAADRRLASLVERFRGLKPPRFESIFESLINGISCQQLSLHVGILLLSRLAREFGLSRGESPAFPRPRDLSSASVPKLRRLGYSRSKAHHIITLARAVASRELDLETLKDRGDDAATTDLLELDGVGRWTAEYALLRGLGRLDVFPADDVSSQAKLQRWRGLRSRPGYDAMHRVLDRFRPYRGMIYFHLLLDSLSRKGFLLAKDLRAVGKLGTIAASPL